MNSATNETVKTAETIFVFANDANDALFAQHSFWRRLKIDRKSAALALFAFALGSSLYAFWAKRSAVAYFRPEPYTPRVPTDIDVPPAP